MKKLRLNKDIVARLTIEGQRRIVGGGTADSVINQTGAYETEKEDPPIQKDTVASHSSCPCVTAGCKSYFNC